MVIHAPGWRLCKVRGKSSYVSLPRSRTSGFHMESRTGSECDSKFLPTSTLTLTDPATYHKDIQKNAGGYSVINLLPGARRVWFSKVDAAGRAARAW